MRPPRRPRLLSGEETRLWGEVAKLITPLRGRAVPKAAATPGAGEGTPQARPSAPALAPKLARMEPARMEPARTEPAVAGLPKAPAKRPRKLADLAPAAPPPGAAPHRPPAATAQAPRPPGLERRERIGLSRGALPIEARIDLHGLYQADAHAALIGFLMRARAAGHARVLVVTGKGSEEAFSERGVLRRAVPHWLRGPELRALVLGFEEAARHHGGAGALYVRLRRR